MKMQQVVKRDRKIENSGESLDTFGDTCMLIKVIKYLDLYSNFVSRNLKNRGTGQIIATYFITLGYHDA